MEETPESWYAFNSYFDYNPRTNQVTINTSNTTLLTANTQEELFTQLISAKSSIMYDEWYIFSLDEDLKTALVHYSIRKPGYCTYQIDPIPVKKPLQIVQIRNDQSLMFMSPSQLKWAVFRYYGTNTLPDCFKTEKWNVMVGTNAEELMYDYIASISKDRNVYATAKDNCTHQYRIGRVYEFDHDVIVVRPQQCDKFAVLAIIIQKALRKTPLRIDINNYCIESKCACNSNCHNKQQ